MRGALEGALDIFISLFLPATLVVIMFSLGIGLRFGDFERIARYPKAFAIGAFSQLILLPVTAYVVARMSGLSPELAVGLMILSLCPGGVTSNFLTKMALGDVALAISLTGVSSLLAVFIMPLLVKLFAGHFLGVAAPDFNVTALGLTMFVITAVPVIVGILVRHYREQFAISIESLASNLATILFVVVVIGALASNWALFVENLPRLGPSVVALNLLLLGFGLSLARMFSLSQGQATAIAIETGVQNATLGITVGTLIVENAAQLPPFSLPSGVYGITMYLISIPFVFWRRSVARRAA